MKLVFCTICAASIALSPLASPSARADDKAVAVAGAIAILGLAALAHNKNHYQEGYQPTNADETAAFERGYRDGLHNEPYDSRHSSTAYGQGFDAGMKERSNSLAHKQRDVGGTKVPQATINGCITEVSNFYDVGAHQVHLIRAGQEGADSFYLEMASGHKHVICESNAKGEIFQLRDGRLPG